MLLGAVAACSPLRQPLGSLALTGAAGQTGTAGAPGAGGTTGGAAPPGTLTGTQIPALPPEWNDCNPNVLRCYQDPQLSVSSPVSALFSGSANPDPAAKPVIVYPLASSMHPINLADITFQWQRGPADAQTLFRIRLARANGDTFEFYVPCNHVSTGPPVVTECVYHLPPGAWIDLATTAHGEALTVDLAGVDPTQPGLVATSDPMSLSFSPDYVSGSLYYWSSTVTGTMRLLFGDRTVQAFIGASSASNPFTCSGCSRP